jgi:ribosomal protein S27AE
MTIRTALYAGESSDHVFARPTCPRCGDVLLVAEESEFDLLGRIRHSWSCDSCGHEFRTSITLRRR